jgi:long-chain acyl-CoA synthetase
VALRPEATATLDDVQQFVRERIAGYKYPRRLWVLDELPKGPTGKILRREVKPPTGD